MNQFFNFNRFSLLVSKHWADNKKRYLLSVIAFMGLLVVWFVFTMLVDSRIPMGQGIQFITYFFLLFIVGSFYANQYFRDLGSRAKGINFLLVPASAFEKILCSLLYNVVLFFIVFTSIFYLVDVLMVAIAKGFVASGVPEKEKGLLNIFEAARLPLENESSLNVLLFFFSIQSVFLLGSVYFEKYSFIKTIISCFVVFFLIFFFVYFLFDMMPKGRYGNHFLTSYLIDNKDKDDYLVRLPVWVRQVLYYAFMYGIAPFFWTATYFRLKEKQV